MKILAIGANGIIGQAVVKQLQQDHQVIAVGHSKGDYRVDIDDKTSIKAMYKKVGKVDAIISMVGKGKMGRFAEIPDQDYQLVLDNKVMGQINLVRLGLDYLNQGGSITLTSGQAANLAMPGTTAIAMGVAAIEAFISKAALELPQGKRINAVSPSMVKETMALLGFDNGQGIAAADLATYYQASVEGVLSGQVLNATNGEYR